MLNTFNDLQHSYILSTVEVQSVVFVDRMYDYEFAKKVNKVGDTMTGPLKVTDGGFWTVLGKDSLQVVDSESRQLTEFRVNKIINRSYNQETGDYNADIKLPEQSGVLVIDSDLAKVENFLERRIDLVEVLVDELAASVLTQEQVDSLF